MSRRRQYLSWASIPGMFCLLNKHISEILWGQLQTTTIKWALIFLLLEDLAFNS